MQRTTSRWGDDGQRPEPLVDNSDLFARWVVSEAVEIDCDVSDAWALVTDVSRIGEFSPECVESRWLDGLGPAVGNRFEGTNRVTGELDGEQHEFEWTRPCTITMCEPDRLFAYTVGDRYDGTAATDWEFELVAIGPSRCRVVQTFRHRPDGLSGIRHRADVDPGRAEEIVRARTDALRAGMRETLSRMKAALER